MQSLHLASIAARRLLTSAGPAPDPCREEVPVLASFAASPFARDVRGAAATTVRGESALPWPRGLRPTRRAKGRRASPTCLACLRFAKRPAKLLTQVTVACLDAQQLLDATRRRAVAAKE